MSMLKNPSQKYHSFPAINLPDRTWPSKAITEMPIWCSFDLRNNNQSLTKPMDAAKKMRSFRTLVQVGLKQIEVAFPPASDTGFNFVRELVEGNHIPDDVTIQALTQTREDLITRISESLCRVKEVIVHVYNATAPSFRCIIFNQGKQGIVDIAINAAKLIERLTAEQPDTQWSFQYPSGIFGSTELEFSVEVCNTVIDIWQPTPSNKIIPSLPTTVECATPNVYASQIEWFGRHVDKRDSMIISLHTHDDRGTGVTATEPGLMAGADRIEGCLFDNNECTDNVGLVTLVLNIYTQGLHPQLDSSDIDMVRRVVEECNRLPIHPRHLYVSDLIHTAFFGSYQDIIHKGFVQQKEDMIWRVPYLPVDPVNIGRDYEVAIRANSQSGKGGITFPFEQEHGISLPRRIQIELSQVMQDETDRLGLEMTAQRIYLLLENEYLEATSSYVLASHRLRERSGASAVDLEVSFDSEKQHWCGVSRGSLEVLVTALPVEAETMDRHEYTIGASANAKATARIGIYPEGQRPLYGVDIDGSITTANSRVLPNVLNRAMTQTEAEVA